MRARPPTLLIATTVVMIASVAACEAKVYGAPHATVPRPPMTRISPLVQEIILPERALPTAGFGELRERIRQATEQAAAQGATISVAVFDRATRRLVSNGNTPAMATASVAKLFIADDLLLREAQGKTTLSPEDHQALDTMLQSSDDDAAEKFWNRGGGEAIITQVANRYGLTSTTPPPDGRWWNTVSSALDLIRYYDMLLDGSGDCRRNGQW